MISAVSIVASSSRQRAALQLGAIQCGDDRQHILLELVRLSRTRATIEHKGINILVHESVNVCLPI